MRPLAKSWHLTPITKLLTDLDVKPQVGLTAKAARERLHRLGPNLLDTKPPVSPLLLFFRQFQDFMVLVLLGTVVISVFLGEYLDATAIFAIVFLNAVLGFSQEYKAEQSSWPWASWPHPTAKYSGMDISRLWMPPL